MGLAFGATGLAGRDLGAGSGAGEAFLSQKELAALGQLFAAENLPPHRSRQTSALIACQKTKNRSVPTAVVLHRGENRPGSGESFLPGKAVRAQRVLFPEEKTPRAAASHPKQTTQQETRKVSPTAPDNPPTAANWSVPGRYWHPVCRPLEPRCGCSQALRARC